MSEPHVALRDVLESDLPLFFDDLQDGESRHMVAFTSPDPTDRAAFDAHWRRILKDAGITKKTVLVNGEVAGHIVGFRRAGKPEVGYWIRRAHWGKGVATRALALFLQRYTVRPLHARVAHDNAASIRVLEKCGFAPSGRERTFANARGVEIEEVILELRDDAPPRRET